MGISGKRVREDLCEEIIFNLRQRMRKSYQAKGTDKQKPKRGGNVVFQGTKKTAVKGGAGGVGKEQKS